MDQQRTQRVVVEGHSSELSPVTSGVPQGSVLGPLLFLRYINNLPRDLSSRVHLFADDCLVYNTNKAELQQDLHKLENWQSTWKMTFIPSKCSTISITTRRPVKIIYKFCGENLESVDSLKCLWHESISQTLYHGICKHQKLIWNHKKCWALWGGTSGVVVQKWKNLHLTRWFDRF